VVDIRFVKMRDGETKWVRLGDKMGQTGSDYAERMRHMDEVLTEILKNEYGKYLGYYPPVYVISKCLEYLRPFYLECENEEDFKKEWSFANFFNNYGYAVENSQTAEENDSATYLEEKLLEDSPKTKKKVTSFFRRKKSMDSPKKEIKDQVDNVEQGDSPKPQKKSMNWFFGNSKSDNATSKQDNTQSQNDNATSKKDNAKPKMTMLQASKMMKSQSQNDNKPSNTIKTLPNEAEHEMSESVYYPFEDSDVDEDDESDIEGEYNFYNDGDNQDRMSIGTESVKSEKELTDMYEKELKTKLVENYVNDDTKEEEIGKKKSYKTTRTNSLKRFVGKVMTNKKK